RHGCIFAPRCPIAEQQCRDAMPPPFSTGPDRTSRCYLHEQAGSLPRATPADVTLPGPATTAEPVVTMRDLSKTFTSRAGSVAALRAVILDIGLGETLGLVGESGSGKTTLARLLLGLITRDDGSPITLAGKPLGPDALKRPRQQLQSLQIVFQNPDSALNRRH